MAPHSHKRVLSESPPTSCSPSPEPTQRLYKKRAPVSRSRSCSPAIQDGIAATQSVDVPEVPARHRYGTRPSTRNAHPAVAAGLAPRTRGSRAEISAAASQKAAEQAAQKERRDAEKARRADHAAEGVKRLAELEDRQEAAELEEERELREMPVLLHATVARTPSPIRYNPTIRDQNPIPSTASKQHTDAPLVDYQSSSGSESDDLEAALARIRSRPQSSSGSESDDLEAALARIRSRPKSTKRQDSGGTNKQAPAQRRAGSSEEFGGSQEVFAFDGESDIEDERSAKRKKRNHAKQSRDKKQDGKRRDRRKRDRGSERLKIDAQRRQRRSQSPTRFDARAQLHNDATRKRKHQELESRSPSPQGPRKPAKKSKSSDSSAFRSNWQAPGQTTTVNNRSSRASGSSAHSGGPRSGWRDVLNIPESQSLPNRPRSDRLTSHDEPSTAFSDRDVMPKVVAEVADNVTASVITPVKTPRQRRRSPNEMPENQSRSATNLPDIIKSVFSAKIVPTVLDCVGSKRNPWDLQEDDRDEFLTMCQDIIDMVCDDGTYRVTKQDTVYRLIQQKVYDWRIGMSNAAITVISEELARKFGTSPLPSVVRHWVDAAIADGGEAFWAKPHPDPQFAHGKLQSIYILKTFATHLTATRDSMYDYGYPAGALALATAAVQKAFPRFREGKYKAGAGFNKPAAEALTESWYDTAVHRFVAKPAKFQALIKMASRYMGVVKARRVQSSTVQAPEAFDRSSPPVEQDGHTEASDPYAFY
ncbi:hypothetical protein GY45DRAFT_1376367 [Cubamyces sp. BRFM 1775]|nr:hypothetical protein GY45DRAFT_1376367 [Cubamyces sp. BRFM 1775]